jgi:hypothetical protein
MIQRPLSILVAISLMTGCAGGGATIGGSFVTGNADYSSTDLYDVKIEQTAYPMSFPLADRGSVDVSFDITIRNASQKPVTIDRISLQSMSGSFYRLDTSSRQYKHLLAAGETFKFKFWASAHLDSATTAAGTPLVVRALVDTIVDGAKQREQFNREVNGTASIGIGGVSGK